MRYDSVGYSRRQKQRANMFSIKDCFILLLRDFTRNFTFLFQCLENWEAWYFILSNLELLWDWSMIRLFEIHAKSSDWESSSNLNFSNYFKTILARPLTKSVGFNLAKFCIKSGKLSGKTRIWSNCEWVNSASSFCSNFVNFRTSLKEVVW
jgi:hypothetical protein